ncbi:MAG: PepSY domain-containing protein [Bacillota bacterium]|nr:PepSY domain-containing protein [Bacillota bacterium]
MNKGKVIDIKNKYVVVMNDQMTYEKIEKKNGLSLGKEIYYFEEDLYKERKQPVKKYFLVAAVLFMMLFIQPLLVAEEAYGYISVDINPSIELQVNKGLDVLSIEAINEDAKIYIKEEWVGKPAQEVIDLIIKETKRKGILNTERNFVLVSYYFNDEDPTSEEVFIQSLDKLFNEKSRDYEVAVIKSDAETYAEAKEANESLGKQVINKKMNKKVDDLLAAKATIEKDKDFKIYKEKDDKNKDEGESSNEKALEDNPGKKNEKNPIFGDRDDVPGLNKQNEDKDREDNDDDQDFRQKWKMITPPEAKVIALALVKGRIVKVKLDRNNSESKYEIDIILDKEIHEIIIDGFTGEVISHKINESDDKDYNEDNKENNKGSDKDDKLDNDKEKNKPNNNGKSAINRKAAEAIAIKSLGGKGEILEFDFDRDGSTVEYTLKIQLNGEIHEMKIDGFTGKLLDHKIEKMKLDDDIETIENSKGNDDESLEDLIDKKEAEEIAYNKIGGQGKIIDYDFDEDELEYTFKIQRNNKIYEIKINGFTGEIQEYKVDDRDKYNQDKEKNIHGKNDKKSQNVLLREEIESIALEFINGEITELKIVEENDEILEYQVIIENEEYIYKLSINGITGEIMEHEKDLIDDKDNEENIDIEEDD